jgi:carbon storage regulator
MLILSRKIGEQIRISEEIVISVKNVKGDRVSIGIEAPRATRVLRGELHSCPRPVGKIARRA